MKTSEKQELNKKLKRIGLFLLIVLVPFLVFCTLLICLNVPQWLNILILVVLLLVLYPLFLWVCAKLDKRKQERLDKKKDPFSD